MRESRWECGRFWIGKKQWKVIAEQVLRVAHEADMAMGSIEYLLGPNRQPFFVDLNPVSGFHPGVTTQLGFDPAERVASWLWSCSCR